jgi:HEAT repeat protein
MAWNRIRNLSLLVTAFGLVMALAWLVVATPTSAADPQGQQEIKQDVPPPAPAFTNEKREEKRPASNVSSTGPLRISVKADNVATTAQPLFFRITIENDGNATLENVILRIHAESGVEFLDLPDGRLSLPLGSLKSRDKKVTSVMAMPKNAGQARIRITAETGSLRAQRIATVQVVGNDAARPIQPPAPTVMAVPVSGPVFQFKIDPHTPLKDLLPVPPRMQGTQSPLLTGNLAKVPEVSFQAPLESQKAREKTAHMIAKIKHLNEKKTDGFLEALLGARTDLAGLGFAMGDSCRMPVERNQHFQAALNTIRQCMAQAGIGQTSPVAAGTFTMVSQASAGFVAIDTPAANSSGGTVLVSGSTLPAPVLSAPPAPSTLPQATGAAPLPPSASSVPGPSDPKLPLNPPPPPVAQPQPPRFAESPRVFPAQASPAVPPAQGANQFWKLYRVACLKEDQANAKKDAACREHITMARIAALMQVLMPESAAMRQGLIDYLATISHPEATRALAKLAVFSKESDVREAACAALKTRRERDYTGILLTGLHYPWPAVARHAAEAIIKLERKDLIPQLVDLLDEADPRLPTVKKIHGKSTPVVSELVRVNHHRNCLMCHAPANPGNQSPDVLTAQVPVPGEPLPSQSQGYGNGQPDMLVRIDVTYLRQDFSEMQPVADAHPWPSMQRFDFLVRSRAITEKEAETYRQKLLKNEPGFVTPYQRAALMALRELTGRDTAPTAEAWRKLLNIKNEG